MKFGELSDFQAGTIGTLMGMALLMASLAACPDPDPQEVLSGILEEQLIRYSDKDAPGFMGSPGEVIEEPVPIRPNGVDSGLLMIRVKLDEGSSSQIESTIVGAIVPDSSRIGRGDRVHVHRNSYVWRRYNYRDLVFFATKLDE